LGLLQLRDHVAGVHLLSAQQREDAVLQPAFAHLGLGGLHFHGCWFLAASGYCPVADGANICALDGTVQDKVVFYDERLARGDERRSMKKGRPWAALLHARGNRGQSSSSFRVTVPWSKVRVTK